MIAVLSSNLDAVDWRDDGPIGTLYVRFKSGDTWRYKNVSPKLYDELLAAPSKGQFFHRRIKLHADWYPGELVRVMPKQREDSLAG